MVKVSIIVPCKTLSEADKCVEECLNLPYTNKEVIVLPDRLYGEVWYGDGLKTLPTGKVLPSRKRDIGILHSEGEIVAFIDADAYPTRNWLNRAVYYLTTFDNLAGVCGAGILPPDATFREQVTDTILKWMPYSFRVTPQNTRFVDDFPTFNLLFWKKHITEAGNFNCPYLTGEDTLICKKIIEKSGKKILYAKDVLVYHHRRPIFKPLWKQVATYGRHRGYFFKIHPETSRRFIYLLPLLIMTMGVICGIFLGWWVLLQFVRCMQ